MLEDTSRKGYAKRGALIGCLTAMFFWWIPIPMALIVWLFDLQGPFGDYMLAAIPVFVALPPVGCVIGLLVKRRDRYALQGGSPFPHPSRKGAFMSGPDDEEHRTWRRTVVRALLVVTAVPPMLLALSLLGLFPWSGVNCSQGDIDITSGRTRHTRYVLWMPVSTTVNDSALTKALSSEDRTNSRAEWHPFVTLSPGLPHSPHYRFHGAISQIRDLEIAWEFGKMNPAARQVTAKRLLHLWRQTGDDVRSKDYVQSVWERALEAERKGKKIDVSDLPMP